MCQKPLPAAEVVRRLFYLAHRWVGQAEATIPFTADDYDTVVSAREWILQLLAALDAPIQVEVTVGNKDQKLPTMQEIREALELLRHPQPKE